MTDSQVGAIVVGSPKSDVCVVGPGPQVGASVVTPPGWRGSVVIPAEQGPPGPPGRDGGGVTYTYDFSTPGEAWSIVHNLGRFPSVTTVDTAGDQVLGDVVYADSNALTVSFGLPVAGVAYLN